MEVLAFEDIEKQVTDLVDDFDIYLYSCNRPFPKTVSRAKIFESTCYSNVLTAYTPDEEQTHFDQAVSKGRLYVVYARYAVPKVVKGPGWEQRFKLGTARSHVRVMAPDIQTVYRKLAHSIEIIRRRSPDERDIQFLNLARDLESGAYAEFQKLAYEEKTRVITRIDEYLLTAKRTWGIPEETLLALINPGEVIHEQ